MIENHSNETLLKHLVRTEIPGYDPEKKGTNPFTVIGHKEKEEGNGHRIYTNSSADQQLEGIPLSHRLKTTFSIVPEKDGSGWQTLDDPLTLEQVCNNLHALSDLLGLKIEQMLKIGRQGEEIEIYSTDVIMRYIVIYMQMLLERGYMKPLAKTFQIDSSNIQSTSIISTPETNLETSAVYPQGSIICTAKDLENPESLINNYITSLQNNYADTSGVLIQCSASNSNDTERNKLSTQIGIDAAQSGKIFVSGGSGKKDSAMDLSSRNYLENEGKLWIAVLTPEIYEIEKVAIEELESFGDRIQIVIAPDWDTRIKVMRNLANYNNKGKIEISHGGLGTFQELLKLTALSIEDIKREKIHPVINLPDIDFWTYPFSTLLPFIGVSPEMKYNEQKYQIYSFDAFKKD